MVATLRNKVAFIIFSFITVGFVGAQITAAVPGDINIQVQPGELGAGVQYAELQSLSDSDLKGVLHALQSLTDEQRRAVGHTLINNNINTLSHTGQSSLQFNDQQIKNLETAFKSGVLEALKDFNKKPEKSSIQKAMYYLYQPFRIIPTEIRLIIIAYMFLTYSPKLAGTAAAIVLEKILFWSPKIFLMCLRLGAGLVGGGMSATWFMGNKLVADVMPQTIMNTQAAINPLSYIFSALDYIRPIQYTELSNIGVLQYMDSVPGSMISHINTTPIGALGYDVPITFGYYSWPASLNYAFAYLARCMGY